MSESKSKDLNSSTSLCFSTDKMVSITLSVPGETRTHMKKFPEINWSGFVRGVIELKVKQLLWKEQMLKQLESEKSFDEEALKLGDKIKEQVWERLKKEGW